MEKDNDCAFEWDNDSQLYFHAGSGFYHDPNAGWYYSSKDGLYYKFENGSYVALESGQGDENKTDQQGAMVCDEPVQDESGHTECLSSGELNNPQPTSEWLEETLIDLYLMGYSNATNSAADDLAIPLDTYTGPASESPAHHGTNDAREIEEGECISEDLQDVAESSGGVSDEGESWEEENWRAQYGQVIQPEEEEVPSFPVVDLWDWAMVTNTVKKKKNGKKKKQQISRLVGKLVRPSTKLHPSMPSGGTVLKTAAIREVHLALVRVSSGPSNGGPDLHLTYALVSPIDSSTHPHFTQSGKGQVYRLRSPSLKYLNTLSTFDSSDPTKSWGFPELSVGKHIIHSSYDVGDSETSVGAPGGETCTPVAVPVSEDSSVLPDQMTISQKHKGQAYRDRAAERRALYGGFGVGPGQKKSGDTDEASSPVSISTEEAAAEALNMSFGAGSYARRLIENMGWKEGEALGSTMKGLIEPLQAVGNKGNAGLGWDQNPQRRYGR